MPSGHSLRENYIVKVRARIQGSKALTRIIEYIEADLSDYGDAEDLKRRKQGLMTQAQVNAAFTLLRKVLPDVTAQTIVVEDSREEAPREMTLGQLMTEWQERAQQPARSHLN